MIPRIKAMGLLVVSAVLLATLAFAEDTTGTWRGLMVAPEHRCSPYDKDQDYPYPQSIEQDIVRRLGGVYGPYTDTCFASTRQTDIEHIVATSEAHDSGLCARDRATRARFASDLRNLTLASPRVNRHRKSGKDAAEWLPQRTAAGSPPAWWKCAAATISPSTAVRRLCSRKFSPVATGTDMEPMACTARPASAGDRDEAAGDDPLAMYDDNGNGRITCKEARRHGIAPVSSDHPAYRYMRDGDGDGVVCE